MSKGSGREGKRIRKREDRRGGTQRADEEL